MPTHLLEEFPRAMAQELMQAHLHLECRATKLQVELLVLRCNEADPLVLVGSCQHVAQGNVLEALVLSDIIIWKREGGREGKREGGREGGRERGREGEGEGVREGAVGRRERGGKGACIQLGMLMPAGMPLEPKAIMSKEVKSGRRNWSFSKAGGHGRRGRRLSAVLTRLENFELMSLSTTATNPA